MLTANYWREEEPVVVNTASNTFYWYKQSGMLDVCIPDYEDKHGCSAPGTTVGINIADFIDSEDAKALFREAFMLWIPGRL